MSFDDGVRRSSADGTAGTAGFPRGSAAGRLAGGGSVRLAAAALVRGDGAAAAEPRPESDDEVVSCMLRSLSTNEALDDGGRSTNSDRRAGTVPLLRKPRLNMDCRLLVEARTAVAVAPPGIHGAPEARPRCTARNLGPGKTLSPVSRRQTSSTVSDTLSHKTKKTNTCRINVIHVHVHVPYAVWSVESVSQSVTPHRPPAPHS